MKYLPVIVCLARGWLLCASVVLVGPRMSHSSLTPIQVRRDSADGVGGFDRVAGSTISPDGRSLYVISIWGGGALSQRDPTGLLPSPAATGFMAKESQ